MWGRELMEPGKMPTADYARVMEDDTALLEWLENLDRCVVMMKVMLMMVMMMTVTGSGLSS